MSVSLFGFVWDAVVYIAVIWAGRCLCQNIDNATAEDVSFHGINPAGSSGGRSILGGRNAGRI